MSDNTDIIIDVLAKELSKPKAKSKSSTLWGLAGIAGSLALGAFGIVVEPSTTAIILSGVGSLVGGLVATNGRVKAESPVTDAGSKRAEQKVHKAYQKVQGMYPYLFED